MATEGLASHLEQVVRDAGEALEALGFEWALVGGLAVSARAEPRFTRDVDLAVSVVADRQAEALIRELPQSAAITAIAIPSQSLKELCAHPDGIPR
jgi:hypothetical protein